MASGLSPYQYWRHIQHQLGLTPSLRTATRYDENGMAIFAPHAALEEGEYATSHQLFREEKNGGPK